MFPETAWSEVLAAAQRTNPEQAREALVRLCERYHGAIREWFRGRTQTREMADDLTQDFLVGWLGRDAPLAEFRRGERRFREFLATCLRRFASTERTFHLALKRGGGVTHVALEDCDPTGAEGVDERLDLELARGIQRAVDAEIEVRWRERVPRGGWQRFRDMAVGTLDAEGYEAFAGEIGIPVGTVKGWVFRFRKERYEMFHRHVLSLAGPTDVPGETRHLLGLLSRYGLGDELH